MSTEAMNKVNGHALVLEFDKFYNIVNGQRRSADKFTHGIDPSNGQRLWDVPVATERDLNDAVAAAKTAFKSWSRKEKTERDQCMKNFLEYYIEHQAEVTELLRKETGKTAFWGNTEIELTKAWLNWPTTIPMPEETSDEGDRYVRYIYRPLGVVGCIVPWNYPLLLGAGKYGSALAAGNTVVLKPSPFTPYTSTKVIEMMQKFFPPGVVNTLTGDEQLGPWMTAHPDIAKISFTGSTPTGKKVMAACASTLKLVTLELGGNDVAIVLPDADPEFVAREVAVGAFQVSGQVCIATKRIYVHSSIYKPFLTAMADFTKRLRVSSTDPNSIIGPVQNKMQFDKVLEIFRDVDAKGYKVAAGGGKDARDETLPTEGYFLRPTIVENPPDDSMIVREEPFGPIVPVMSYETVEEVIARANDDPNGLGGSVWGNNTEECQKVADQLETGSVWINSFALGVPNVYLPPWKQSGIGGEWGKKGLIDMCRVQVQHIQICRKQCPAAIMARLNFGANDTVVEPCILVSA